jgi:formylglycine-generating enzyme required for sulfatase activity
MLSVPGTERQIELVAMVPNETTGIAPFYVASAEITWDIYDVFTYRLDVPEGSAGADAVTRPSKPYIAMDRGFGSAGYPAISMSANGAMKFCEWLSAKTGRRIRLPAEAEWRWLCERSGVTTATLDEHAWHAGNASYKTHAVASKAADANGIHDLLGNASEWCVGDDGRPVTLGGNYRTPADQMNCAWRELPTPAWNASDPQFPKSVWWLADGGFVGFRIVVEVEGHSKE